MQIVIIGGGASGFMAAITAAETFPDARITILEKNKTVLNKVRISGGGRCNVTHKPSDSRFFIKNYPRGEKFLKKLLTKFDAQATVDWFEKRGVKLKTETDGRMFPVFNFSNPTGFICGTCVHKIGCLLALPHYHCALFVAFNKLFCALHDLKDFLRVCTNEIDPSTVSSCLN